MTEICVCRIEGPGYHVGVTKCRGPTSPSQQFSFTLNTTRQWGDLTARDHFSIKICDIDLFCLKTKHTRGLCKVAMYLTGMTGSIIKRNCTTDKLPMLVTRLYYVLYLSVV